MPLSTQALTISAPITRPLYQKILLLVLIMTVIGGSLTGVMTYFTLGVTDTFMSDWLQAFVTAVCLMIPAGFTFMMFLNFAVGKLLPEISEIKKNMLIGIIMALFMEAVMAIGSAATNVGFSDLELFSDVWLQAYLTALPLGMLIAVIMTLTLRPKIQRFMAS
jgi:hypothetical protein